MSHDAGTVVVPIERAPSGAWLSGPREPAFDQPPLDVEIFNMGGLITLDLTRNHGHWIEASEPAAARYAEVIGQLRATGWRE